MLQSGRRRGPVPVLLPGDNPQAYIPGDRRRALSRGEDLPVLTHGSAVFVDISGWSGCRGLRWCRTGSRYGLGAWPVRQSVAVVTPSPSWRVRRRLLPRDRLCALVAHRSQSVWLGNRQNLHGLGWWIQCSAPDQSRIVLLSDQPPCVVEVRDVTIWARTADQRRIARGAPVRR